MEWSLVGRKRRMCSCLISVAGILLSTTSAAMVQTAVNAGKYDYVYVDLSSGSYDKSLGGNNNVTAMGIGASSLYDDQWLLVLDYSARFFHPDNITEETYTLRAGAGYRYAINEQWDISTRAKVGSLWNKVTQDNPEVKLFSDSKFVYSIDASVNYFVTKQLELAAIGELSRSNLVDEDKLQLRADYHFEDNFAIGVLYTHRDFGEDTTNEGGLSLRYRF
ncbi:outer membrane beta-barrel protein [Vibrio paucivorans]